MKKLQLIWGLLFTLLFLTCSRQQISSEDKTCSLDTSFEENFSNWLSILAVNRAGLYVDGDDLVKAYRVIQRVTGIESKAAIGNDTYIYYDSHSSYIEDLSAWTDWYKMNKCKWSLAMVDSLMKRDIIVFPDYDSESQKDYLRVRYPDVSYSEARMKDSISRIEFVHGLPRLSNQY